MKYKLNLQMFGGVPVGPSTSPKPPEPGYEPFYNYFILNGITTTILSNPSAPGEMCVITLFIIYHNGNIYGLSQIVADAPTVQEVLDNGVLILENVNPEYTGAFFQNLHGSGREDDPYYLVEDEVIIASYLANFTTYHTEKTATPQVTIDLTTLEGWDDLASGEHTITVKAKATGYQDSEESEGVTVTKAATGETWIINETFNDLPTNITTNISFTSNNKTYTSFTRTNVEVPFELDNILYGDEMVYGESFEPTFEGWKDQAYRTITFETAPTGDLLTWLQANAVKQ